MSATRSDWRAEPVRDRLQRRRGLDLGGQPDPPSAAATAGVGGPRGGRFGCGRRGRSAGGPHVGPAGGGSPRCGSRYRGQRASRPAPAWPAQPRTRAWTRWAVRFVGVRPWVDGRPNDCSRILGRGGRDLAVDGEAERGATTYGPATDGKLPSSEGRDGPAGSSRDRIYIGDGICPSMPRPDDAGPRVGVVVTAQVVASPEGWQVSVPVWSYGREGWLAAGVMADGGAVVRLVGDGGGGWC